MLLQREAHWGFFSKQSWQLTQAKGSGEVIPSKLNPQFTFQFDSWITVLEYPDTQVETSKMLWLAYAIQAQLQQEISGQEGRRDEAWSEPLILPMLPSCLCFKGFFFPQCCISLLRPCKPYLIPLKNERPVAKE